MHIAQQMFSFPIDYAVVIFIIDSFNDSKFSMPNIKDNLNFELYEQNQARDERQFEKKIKNVEYFEIILHETKVNRFLCNPEQTL